MKNIYDNGTCLLGTKKNIEENTKKTLKEMQKINDDYVVDTCYLVLDSIKNYKDNDILFINYDKFNGLGFEIECFKESNIIKD